MTNPTLSERYARNGYVSPACLISESDATAHRAKFEAVEAAHGSQHYKSKMHTLLDFAAELTAAPQVLDTVQQLPGSNRRNIPSPASRISRR